MSLTRREIIGRYRGSVLGMLWSLFNPLLMLAVYTFVFAVVMKARWSDGGDSKSEFALVLFVGLIVFNLFSDCINRAPNLILANVNYVKKIVFPLEILPWVSMLSALFHLLVSLAVWVVFHFWVLGPLKPSALLLPFVLLPLVLMTMGLSWALASLAVYLRDVSQVVGALTTLLMFLSPVFYPMSSLPPAYQRLLALNPLTKVIEQSRAVLIWGRTPSLDSMLVATLIAAAIAWLGFVWFQKTRSGFADVL